MESGVPSEAGEVRLVRGKVALPARTDPARLLKKFAAQVVATRPGAQPREQMPQQRFLILARQHFHSPFDLGERAHAAESSSPRGPGKTASALK